MYNWNERVTTISEHIWRQIQCDIGIGYIIWHDIRILGNVDIDDIIREAI